MATENSGARLERGGVLALIAAIISAYRRCRGVTEAINRLLSFAFDSDTGEARLESLSYKIIDRDIKDEEFPDDRDAERNWEPPETAKSVRFAENQKN